MTPAPSLQTRLAIVDADPAVRHALSFAFETAGFSVTAFADAESMLASPERGDWRCLVLDQKLPGLSGLDLLARLRGEGIGTPSVLITTNPSSDTKRRALAVGVDIIEKPLLDNRLTQSVLRLVGQA